MSTFTHLVNKLEKDLSVSEYNRHGKWFIEHINRICAWYPFIKVGAIIKVDIEGEIITRVIDFHFINGIDGIGILVETEFGNVFYYETKEPTKKEMENYLDI